ncbi:transposase [Streptomyces sp. NPDC058257]|uniref:transposase n=1 Tax=Streptomyces sp. NPDC058257 TaxID=3346409 RepID=UPI0036E6B167
MVFDKKYTDEVRRRAVERVHQRRLAEPTNRAIVREVAEEYEVGPQSLRKWLNRYDDGSYDYDSVDGQGEGPGQGHEDGWQPPAAPTGRQEHGTGRRELLARIAELEHHIAVLREDNRSLTRVVLVLADQLREATTSGGVQIPAPTARHAPRA